MLYKNILYIDKIDSIYTRAIITELKKSAIKVDCFFYKDLIKIPIFQNKAQPNEAKKKKNEILNSFRVYLKSKKYDFILIKSPYVWPQSFFEELSENFKGVPIVNYNWSSIKMYDIIPYRECFSKVYSFDPDDCNKYGFEYYPLFYLKDYQELQTVEDKIFDFSFIGTGYSAGRVEFMKSLIELSEKIKCHAFIYFFTPGVFKSLKFKVKNNKISKYCYWQFLSLNEVLNITGTSFSAIDHPMSIQTGLTIRTFETLGAGLHLYTTNKAIANEPFYNSNRITIINSDLKGFSIEGIKETKQNKSWQESFTQYRIDNWVKKILDVNS